VLRYRPKPNLHRQVAFQRTIVNEIFLDLFTLVTKSNHEFVIPIMGIMFHDMPKDRPRANLDHGFRLQLGFFRKAATDTAGKNSYFHFHFGVNYSLRLLL